MSNFLLSLFFRLFKACGMGKVFGPKCHAGDRIGCGIKPSVGEAEIGAAAHTATVFFTRNGREVCCGITT